MVRLLFVCTFALLLNVIFSSVEGSSRNDYHITYPERADNRRARRDLSTSEKGSHLDDVSYRLKAFDKDWILDIKRNKELISPYFAMRTFANDGSEIMQQGGTDDCHYQGTIRGMKDSSVVLNTCSGLRGIIDDGKDTFYVTPDTGHKVSGAHKVFQAKEDDSKDIHKNCGNEEKHADAPVSEDNSGPFSKVRRSISNADDIYKPYLTTKETRYNELVLVADFAMYLKHNNDTAAIRDRVITLVNAVDAIYQRANIRIVLKGLEIWTNGDPYERKSKGGPDLSMFKDYRNEHLKKKFAHDNAHLLSSRGWSDCLGMAYVFGMCGSVSCGVNGWDMGSIIGPYVVLAHEMGHNFGFSHDSGTCKCLTPRGCIMGGHKTRVPGFSNCSMEALKRLNDWCLYNVPTDKSMNSYCGNGIREEGEECDCGTPEICKTKDPCCEPHNCILKKEAQCSGLHHTCCEKCLFKNQGTLCRGVKTDCDVPEYCTGDSRDCPADSFIVNGYPCNQTKTVIQGSTNYHSVFTRNLNPKVNARYLRISPQYWYGYPCLRTDFLGCNTDQVSPTAATPLKSYGLNLCLTPSNKTCSPPDNDRLVYVAGDKCSESHLQFSLGSDSVLRHSCSGKMVCPQNGNNGAKIVVSSSCTVDYSKFERTPGRSLKHIQTGKCIHTNGAWPGAGREMVLWSGCDVQRLELWFVKQECVDRLGMQNGDIKDSQITASSSRPADLPHYGRLHNGKYWCPAKANKKEHFQVDFSQLKTINKILIQGRGNWYNWVTGFYLYYSDDGQRWTGYSASGDKNHSNSVCYLGKCSEIHETQCKDLWGATANNADKGCYDKLNTEAAGYGTCDPTTNASCAASDVLCGQLQCQDSRNSPVVDYGRNYTKIQLNNGKQCSAAILKSVDVAGLGMVRDGTKCGADKMCVNNKCQSFDQLNIGKCPVISNKECGGRGVCTNKQTCHCEGGFDPKLGCGSVLVPRDGAWGEWSSWTVCDKGCNGGKRKRHRFCDNPFPLHGGADCPGNRHETEDCNVESCPVAMSCRHLQKIAQEKNRYYPDGVYKINPTGSQEILAFCDMSSDGGGWTLLVASHTNSWTENNVILRNSPKLYDDYSILKYADSIKDNINVGGTKFEYRLEAQSRGRWGGIWEAPRGYTFTSRTNKQTNVELIKKFDNWDYSNSGIEQRMPWIADARLTTSGDAYSNWWGTITGNDRSYHPAPWINGHLQERQPSYIWYWMREGPYQIPRSCMEVNFRGILTNPVSNGVFTIKPPGLDEVKTYCDFTTEGGPWTLLLTSGTHGGWDTNNIKQRNVHNASLHDDFSILGYADAIKDFDKSQEYFQYRIEADGTNRWGGIWEAPRTYTFLSTCDKQTKVTIVKKFDPWNEDSNLVKRMPRLGLTNDLLLSSTSVAEDTSGTLVFNRGAGSPTYIKEKPNPAVVRYWMREGARWSCNDLKLNGLKAGKTYEDGVQMIKVSDSQYLPVYCDMSHDGGGWTLLVTSHTNSWSSQNVILRNAHIPRLHSDYSILKYADGIKDNINVEGSKFEYRLEAQSRGQWGGIWEAPRSYSFMARNNKQTDVTLTKKYDNWDYSNHGIEKRMPWIADARLTTSGNAYSNWWGTITADDKDYNPAPWMSGQQRLPAYIWYWIRERSHKFPRSCMEVKLRGLQTKPVSDGVFTIKPPGLFEVKTYCDFTTEGGPWTLLVTSKTHGGWDKDNIKQRNSNKPSLHNDFSILGFADAVKDFDKSQEYFHYRIEADGIGRWGGIWKAPRDYTFFSTSDKQTEVTIIKKFDSWDEDNTLAKQMPRLGLTQDILMSTSSTSSDTSGTLVFNIRAGSPTYLKEKPHPVVVRYWMREGVRLSCNDLKVHGVRAGNQYEDGFQLIKVNDTQYLPVYCDMTTSEGGFTLLVTSAHNNWTRAQVPSRNPLRPALNKDYSILNLADGIRDLSNNDSFQYMMDANSRRHWGGIFRAPSSYSFLETNSHQTNVQLIRKFNNWEYSWWKSLNPRMPWFDATGTHSMALLTTSSSPTSYPSGSIIWGGVDRHPADWIWDGGMRDPGVIWYWVNEDDCDADRKSVDGGFTEWSQWGRCDKICENGKERRIKTCTNPKPRCGGKQCNSSVTTVEERPCMYCPESGIRSYGDYCVAPNTGGCSPPNGAHLIFTKQRGSACNETDMIFVFDWDGVIHHKCSKKVICPQNNYPSQGRELTLKDNCDLSISRHTRLQAYSALKNQKNDYCVHPYGGWPGEGVSLVYWDSCGSERLELDFFQLDPPTGV